MIAIPIHDRRRGRVSRQAAFIDRSLVKESPGMFVGRDVAPQIHTAAIEQQVESAVSVPIRETELSAPAAAGDPRIQP